jgi:hypothetical protein
MKQWWHRMADGAILVIHKNGDYKFDTYESHASYSDDKTIKKIVWSGQSTDVLNHLCFAVLTKFPADVVRKLMRGNSASSLKFLVANTAKLLKKHHLHTPYDYVFAGTITPNTKALIKKFNL